MGKTGKRALAEIAQAIADRRAAEKAAREARGRAANETKEEKPATVRELVTPEARQHGSYAEQFMPDLSVQNQDKRRMVKVIRNLYPSVVDRWLAEGGPGFEEPQRAAIEHCRGLWKRLGTQRLVANLNGTPGGRGDVDGEWQALHDLANYEGRIPHAYWSIFENVVRFDMGAGQAGSQLANTSSQRQAHAKAVTGMVASLIAMWRGY